MKWPRALSTSNRRLLAGGIAVVVVGTVVITSLSWRGDRLPGEVAEAITDSEPLATKPIATSIPPDCGLRQSTIDRFVPEGDRVEGNESPDQQTCSWRPMLATDPLLEVEVQKKHELSPPESRVSAAADAYDQIQYVSDSDTVSSFRPVAGIGAQAVTWHEKDTITDEEVTAVAFWQGNVTAKVQHHESYQAGVRAAADVARGMGVTVAKDPRVTERPDKTVAKVPEACDLLPSSVASQLPGSGKGTSTHSYLISDEEGAGAREESACEWGDTVTVEIAAAAGSDTFTGEQAATNSYLQTYLSAKSDDSSSPDDPPPYVRSLRGIGDEAYLEFSEDAGVDAAVVFRVDDVLVRARADSIDDGYGKRDAMSDAYRAAKAAAAKLR